MCYKHINLADKVLFSLSFGNKTKDAIRDLGAVRQVIVQKSPLYGKNPELHFDPSLGVNLQLRSLQIWQTANNQKQSELPHLNK